MDTSTNSWKEKRRAKEARASLWRRLRAPLLSGGMTLVFAFVGVPLLFNVLGLAPTIVEVSAAMVNAAPTPTPRIEITTVAAALPSDEDSARSQTAASKYKALRQGDTDEIVSSIQLRLMELEYMEGDEPTTLFGEQTAEAIKRFQRVHHMTQTGEADTLTQELLFSDKAAIYRLQEGDSGSDVKRLQNQFYDLGYYAEKRNGYFGSATEEALRAFQTKNKLEPTGIADQETRDILFSSKARPKVDPTPTPKPSATAKPSKTSAPSSTKAPSFTAAPSKTKDPLIATTNDPGSSWTGPSSGSGSDGIVVTGSGVEAMIAAGQSKLGYPYVLGDEGPNTFDCSGFVYFCLRSAGVKTSRMAAKSFAQVSSWQTITDRNSLERGDLLFFTNSVGASTIGHTGIYLGGGKYIHASSSAGKVIISSWSNWSISNFQWAKRVF